MQARAVSFPTGMSTMIWEPYELDILRRPATAAEMLVLLPHRTNMSIRLRRRLLAKAEGFEPVNAVPDYTALAARGVASRRDKENRNKSAFILAVSNGAVPTHTGIVSRSAYQQWRNKDPEFQQWFDSFKIEKRASRERIRAAAREAIQRKRTAKKRAETARAAPMGENHGRARMECDVYKVASAAIGRRGGLDICDAAISAMVLDLLEGVIAPEDCKRLAGRYVTGARTELSYKGFDEITDMYVSFESWVDGGGWSE